MPPVLSWPFTQLERAIGLDRLKDWYSPEQIATWRDEGLGDYEADEIAIHFGLMAHFVWPGWTAAGEDCDVYP